MSMSNQTAAGPDTQEMIAEGITQSLMNDAYYRGE